MAFSAIKNEEEKIEYFDEPDVLEEKITKLAELVRNSKNMQTFTGAGISTAAGIPDYRSGANTVVETGAGCWERALQADCAHIEVDCGQLVLPAGLQDGNLVVGLPRRWS